MPFGIKKLAAILFTKKSFFGISIFNGKNFCSLNKFLQPFRVKLKWICVERPGYPTINTWRRFRCQCQTIYSHSIMPSSAYCIYVWFNPLCRSLPHSKSNVLLLLRKNCHQKNLFFILFVCSTRKTTDFHCVSFFVLIQFYFSFCLRPLN